MVSLPWKDSLDYHQACFQYYHSDSWILKHLPHAQILSWHLCPVHIYMDWSQLKMTGDHGKHWKEKCQWTKLLKEGCFSSQYKIVLHIIRGESVLAPDLTAWDRIFHDRIGRLICPVLIQEIKHKEIQICILTKIFFLTRKNLISLNYIC